MAVPGIRNHRKFRRLRSILKDFPDVYIEAHLNAMWTPAYQSADPNLGDARDVELAAEWECSGRPDGQWFEAVLEVGFVDRVTHDNAGNAGVRYCVHDLFDWCPSYVLDRAAKSDARRREKRCNACGQPYFSSEPHSKYCGNTCRQKAFRDKLDGDTVTQHNAGVTHVTNASVTRNARNELPSPPTLPINSLPPSDGEFEKVVGAFKEWASSFQPENPPEIDVKKISAMLDALSAPDLMEVIGAVGYCRKNAKEFRSSAYAVGVVRGVIEERQHLKPKIRSNGKSNGTRASRWVPRDLNIIEPIQGDSHE